MTEDVHSANYMANKRIIAQLRVHNSKSIFTEKRGNILTHTLAF